MKSILVKSSLLAIFCFATSCITTHEPKDAEDAFSIAKQAFDERSYDLAVKKLNEFRSRFPYSKLVPDAVLLIGESEFAQQLYEEAALTFTQFATLYPNHTRRPYALFKVGDSYWQLAPTSFDRDQGFNQRAVNEWSSLIKAYPESPEAKQAKALSREGWERLARNEEFIASFYCRLRLYHSCAFRSIGMARRYEDLPDFRTRSLVRASEALVALAEQVPPADQKEEVREANLYFRDLNAEQLRQLSTKLLNESKKSS